MMRVWSARFAGRVRAAAGPNYDHLLVTEHNLPSSIARDLRGCAGGNRLDQRLYPRQRRPAARRRLDGLHDGQRLRGRTQLRDRLRRFLLQRSFQPIVWRRKQLLQPVQRTVRRQLFDLLVCMRTVPRRRALHWWSFQFLLATMLYFRATATSARPLLPRAHTAGVLPPRSAEWRACPGDVTDRSASDPPSASIAASCVRRPHSY